MTDSRPGGVAVVERYILREHNAVLAVADFSDLFEEFRRHTRRWDSEIEPLTEVMMRQGLAGAVLQLSFKVPYESIGWTLNFHKPPINCFITGSSVQATVTGRVFTEGVQTVDNSRLYVQIHRPGSDPSQTVLDVQGLDVLEIFEQYFERSVQTSARFLELTDEKIAMVQGLPRVDLQWLAGLDSERVRGLLDARPESVESKEFRFDCGCDAQRVVHAMHRFFSGDIEGLFQGEEGVEALCPRCGVRYWIERTYYLDTIRQDSDQ